MPTRSATAKVPRPLTLSQRKTLATEQLMSALSSTNKDAALTAALEVVNEWLLGDTEVHHRLQERYAELEALAKPKTKAAPLPKLIPISGPDLDHFNPYATPDPYTLLDWYGREQLRAVITGATLPLLREFVDTVQAREPGTKPASKSKKKDMVDYVVVHVAGPEY